jgi:Ubiquitin-conjugating enzyme
MKGLPAPNYDFNNPHFQRMRQHIRPANEHIALAKLQSPVIEIEIAETDGPLQIPIRYLVHYNVRSILGIDAVTLEPTYGNRHTMEISLPPQYPMEPPKIYMRTEIWHPNIKFEGKYQGRICGNQKNFGKAYGLDLLVLRVGEIIQYKNYHADHTPPFPEDSTVANWVKTYAEPNEIVHKDKGIFTDYSSLIGLDAPEIIENIEPVIAPETTAAPAIKFGTLRPKQPTDPANRPKFNFGN